MTDKVNGKTPLPSAEKPDRRKSAPHSAPAGEDRETGRAHHGAPRAQTDAASRRGAKATAHGPEQRGRGHKHATDPRANGNRPASKQRRRRGPCIAALDLGTNNCRILIARAEGASFQVVDAFSRVVRLGEGLAETGALSEEAMERAISALSICSDRIRKHRVIRFRAIATEACRRASNCSEFLRRVEERTGLRLDVIDAAEEARLAVAGCAPLIDVNCEQLVVFDIGGGSTELIHVNLAKAPPAKRKALLMALAHGDSRSERARAAGRYISDWISVPVGVVTLGERFSEVGEPDRFYAMEQHVADALIPFTERAGLARPARSTLAKTQLLGASGTITTLAGVHLGLPRYERHRVDGLWVAPHDIDGIIEGLIGMSYAERAAIPCVGTDRASNLLSGAAILRAILRSAPSKRLRVADRGLREGVLYGLAQDGLARRARQRR